MKVIIIGNKSGKPGARKERAESKAILASSLAGVGAGAGGVVGGPVGAAIGGVGGGLLGLIIGDSGGTFPVDYVAVPAYEYSSVLAGRSPSHVVFIKAGETLVPTGGNVDDVELGEAEAASLSVPKKRRRSRNNKWNAFVKKEWRAYKKAHPKGKKTFAEVSKAASRKYKRVNK